MIDPNDLINATEVAAELGLRHREAVATYRGRYPEFPSPMIEKGTCVLWHRLAIHEWDEWRRKAQRGPLVWCQRLSDGKWKLTTNGLPQIGQPLPTENFMTAERIIRAAIDEAFAPGHYNPEFRLAEPATACVYCESPITATGGASGVGATLRRSGKCDVCEALYRSAGPAGWTLS
ncbi:MAG: hypothetical protein ABMA25_15070 [Ilumatobacteraceae bacterium]